MANDIVVLLIDGDDLSRDGLAEMITGMPGVQLAASCPSVLQSLVQLPRQHVDVVLLNAQHTANAINFIPRARALGYRGPVVVLGFALTPSAGGAFVQQGVSAICPVNLTAEELREVLQLAVKGVTTIEERYFRAATERQAEPSGQEFTDREWQIIYCLMEGLSNKQIAARIRMSEATVKAELRRIYDTVGVRSRARLVCLLADQNYLRPRVGRILPFVVKETGYRIHRDPEYLAAPSR